MKDHERLNFAKCWKNSFYQNYRTGWIYERCKKEKLMAKMSSEEQGQQQLNGDGFIYKHISKVDARFILHPFRYLLRSVAALEGVHQPAPLMAARRTLEELR